MQQKLTLEGWVGLSVSERRYDEIASAPAFAPEHTAEVLREMPVPQSPTVLAAVTSCACLMKMKRSCSPFWQPNPLPPLSRRRAQLPAQ
jgi:hypothetical protein